MLAGSGRIQPTPTTWANDILALRLLPGGAPDTSFAGDGIANVDVGPLDSAQSVLLQGDGKIVVVGGAIAHGFTTTPFGTKADVAVVRLLGVSNPDVLAEALLELVRTMAEFQVLSQGRARSLQSKLQATLNQIDHHNLVAAANQIGAFRNEVLALHGANVLSAADTDALLAGADGILAALGANP